MPSTPSTMGYFSGSTPITQNRYSAPELVYMYDLSFSIKSMPSVTILKVTIVGNKQTMKNSRSQANGHTATTDLSRII